MIKIWNIKGNIKSEIGHLVRFYSKTFRRSYCNFLGKGAMGKRLEFLIKETHYVSQEDLINNKLGTYNKDGSINIPETYEEWLEKQKQIETQKILGPAFSGNYSAAKCQDISTLQE
jgi:hypothetical protein